MNEIRYYVKQSKKDKQGRIPIYLIFQYDGTQFEYYTKEKCTLDQWDADKMKFKRSMPGYQEANEQLQMSVSWTMKHLITFFIGVASRLQTHP